MCLTEISWTNITIPLPGSMKVNICWMLLLKSDWLPRETREMIFTCAYRAYRDKLALQVKVLGRSIRCYSIISLYSRQHLVRKQPNSNKYFHLLQKSNCIRRHFTSLISGSFQILRPDGFRFSTSRVSWIPHSNVWMMIGIPLWIHWTHIVSSCVPYAQETACQMPAVPEAQRR